MNSSRTERGFTLIQLVVVIVVIGILLGLAVPAIQAVRESARRQTCQHRMMQIGLALTEYHTAMLSYPHGTVNPNGPIRNVPEGFHQNWVSGLLLRLDLPTVAAAVDSDASVYAPENEPVRRVQLAVLQCPSASSFRSTGSSYAVSNYAGCHHPLETPIAEDNGGIFVLNQQISQDDVHDGLQYTLMVGEKLAPQDDLGWLSGTRATLRNTGHAIDSTPGQTSGGGSAHEDPLYVGGFASAHPGGANFLLADGRVRFFDASTDLRTLAQLAHRDDRGVAHAALAE